MYNGFRRKAEIKGVKKEMKALRSFLIMLLLAALMLPMVCIAEEKPLTIVFLGTQELSQGGSGNALKTRVASTESGKIVFTLTDTRTGSAAYTETRYGIAAGQEITWSVPYDKAGLSYSKPVKRMKAAFEMDGKTYTYSLYYRLDEDGSTVCVEKATWYPNNTACSFGPQFREIKPGLTDKWYMFTPVNLSSSGRQVFEYVAGSVYVIGQVYVDVNGDTVRVTYENFCADEGGNTETVSEYFTFFSDLASVKDVEPETMDDLGFRFGQEISIENDLNGDTSVLLFVRNRVNFRDYVTNSRKLTRFWINLPERAALRQQMIAIMD